MDSSNPGKLFFPTYREGKTHFELFIDFKVDLASDLGFVQWSMCATDSSIKTALLGKVKFIKGENSPYEITFNLPSNPVEYSMSLMKLGWKGEE
jgi:hypothetical protein